MIPDIEWKVVVPVFMSGMAFGVLIMKSLHKWLKR